jgi:hypothetical protein
VLSFIVQLMWISCWVMPPRQLPSWAPEFTFDQLVADMCDNDYKLAKYERTAP